MVIRTFSLNFCLLLALGCEIEAPPESTGGVEFGQRLGENCDRGLVIVESDYKSTNIAVSTPDGSTLSGSFVSAGAKKPGLSLALSGDVDVPFVAPTSERLVLIDRYGTNVLTWLETKTAKVIAQLPIGQGFESNPHDYIEVDERRAFVSRFGTNPNPGASAFDDGGDLLIVDTQKPEIIGRIAIPEGNSQLYPRPSGMNRLGAEVVVSLSRGAPDFSKVGEGRFVGVSPASNAVTWTVDVAGLIGCGRVAVSPDATRLAIACSSQYDKKTQRFDPKTSDIVLFDATVRPPKELKRFGVAVTLDSGIQPALAFVNNETLFAKTYGGNSTVGDRAFSLNTATGEVSVLTEAGNAYAFGGLRCSPGCSDICVLSDVEQNVLRRWHVGADGVFSEMGPVKIETVVGLPPRSIGGI